MELLIQVRGSNGEVKDEVRGEHAATLVYGQAYVEGDALCLSASQPCYVVAQLEDSISPTFAWLRGPYQMAVPFGEKRVSYSPKSFTGDTHLLTVRLATPAEVSAYRNLALNPLDCHENTGLFPHASANVETRGESVFAARNAINGNTCNHGHGVWPFESWGINRRDDAEIKIDFGRMVEVDRLIVTLRADFPHDNCWQTAVIAFSDGSFYQPQFTRTAGQQLFEFEPRQVSWAVMKDMQKDPSDPSPFPALTHIEFWGTNKEA